MTPRTGAVALAASLALAGPAAAPALAADPPAPPPEVTAWIPVSDTPITIIVSSGTVVPSGPGSPAPAPAPTGIEVAPPTATAPPQNAPATSAAQPPGSPAPSGIEVAPAPPPRPTSTSTSPVPTSSLAPPPATAAPTRVELAPPPPGTTRPTAGQSMPVPTSPTSTTAAATSTPPSSRLDTPTAGPAPLAEPGTPAAPGTPPPVTAAPPAVQRPAPTDPTPTPAPAGRNASGKPWKSGVFGHNTEYISAWEQTTGQSADVLTVFPTRGSWDSMMGDWWLSTAPPGFNGTLSVGIPPWPEDGSLATAAAGGYNDQWKKFARLVASKYPDAYIRIGWEFNIPSWYWYATPENVDQWKAAWRHAARSMKSAAPGLRMDWNPNGGPGETIKPATLAYPGDDVVDVVGVDAYDWWPAVTSDETWQKRLTEDGGLQSWAGFARAHGKKLSFPEWGVVTKEGKDAGGDNPEYIRRMTEFFAANATLMAYDSYFDEREGGYLNSSLAVNAPKAGQEYRALSATIRAGGIAALTGQATAMATAPGGPGGPGVSTSPSTQVDRPPTAGPAPADQPQDQPEAAADSQQADEPAWAPGADGHGAVPTSTP